jgi:hypothetical protein
MFDPQLFGFLSIDYFRFAQTLLVPTLGFMFLYFLRLPLRKLPIISDATDYAPPPWLLPMFALGSLFLFCLSLSIGLFLVTERARAPIDDFVASYHRIRDVEWLSNADDPLTAVDISVDQFQIVSDVRIFVNGYRIFGSSSNCMAWFQCKPAGDPEAKMEYSSLWNAKPKGASILHVGQMFELPHVEPIKYFLTPGLNMIDIGLSNSGLETCSLHTSLIFRSSKSPDRQYTLDFSSNSGPDAPVRAKLSDTETFYPISSTPSSFHVCGRVRIQLTFTPEIVQSLYTPESWQRWAIDRDKSGSQ